MYCATIIINRISLDFVIVITTPPTTLFLSFGIDKNKSPSFRVTMKVKLSGLGIMSERREEFMERARERERVWSSTKMAMAVEERKNNYINFPLYDDIARNDLLISEN
jgi:hypothetical protein